MTYTKVGDSDTPAIPTTTGIPGPVSKAKDMSSTAIAEKPCKDSLFSGVQFTYGQEAQCSDLLNYCKHATYGDKVRTNCPETCGMCAIVQTNKETSKIGAPLGADGLARCTDVEAQSDPQVTIGGQLAGCSLLKPFCSGHVDS